MVDIIGSVLPAELSKENIELLLILGDVLIHEISAEDIKPYLSDDFPLDKLDDYLSTYTRPSKIEGYKEYLREIVISAPTESVRLACLVFNVLDSRVGSPFLTGSLTLIRDMTPEQREAVVKSWRDSPIASKRRLFKSLCSMNIVAFTKLATDLHYQAIGHPSRDRRVSLYEGQKIDDFRYSMKEKPSVNGQVLHLPDTDVLIIGSGSGSGVVADTLSEQGFKCLVLEKGKYYHPNEFNFDEKEGGEELYESKGSMATLDQSLFILAGSTFGGGSTVNWSACLKTPFKVRKEWYDNHGVDFVASEKFDKCQDFVWKKMGASDEHINHSFSNKVILEGGEKLGYEVAAIAQNTGGHVAHDCGFCHLGCKYGIKQGASVCWFKNASQNGCEFMDQVKVIRLIHKGGKATAALCKDTVTGVEFQITGPRKFIVAGGALNTPVLLNKSGFKNKHIGKNLKLHPVSVLLGDFGKHQKIEPHHHSIMTAICTEAADLDGKGHGARIETILHSPHIQQVFNPWDGSDKLRKDLMKYNNMAAMLILARDTSSGKVYPDPYKEDTIVVDYAPNKFDLDMILQTLLYAADLLYIQGAETIIAPHSHKLKFHSTKPKEQRSIKDKDYVLWRKRVAAVKMDKSGSPLGTAHQMSTCRISGKGPSDGACDLKGRLYECSNVHVADASVLPTASGANPMITTMALARHIALEIAKDLRPHAKL